ncbi:MAG: polysaccharide biosynthesis/export family protein [Acidobacteria bacterium]|nr:polysaccharide biosynthesis/export family protein [Acidobacteriota bacterium]
MSALLLSLTVSAVEPVRATAVRPLPTTAQAQQLSNEPATPEDYVIGPGDVLGVQFWREAEMSGDVTVRPDGRITLPVIGEIQAAGLRPEALKDQILAAASKFMTDPNVAIVIRTINSRKVFITGRVTTPGAHLLVAPLTVLQAIALAGGLTEYADSKNITILRNENGEVRSLKFNYKDVSKGRNLSQNIQLLPGDTVVVP